MRARRDPISVVEACYDLAAPERQWLQAIANAFDSLVQPGPAGMLGYHVQFVDQRLHIEHPVQTSSEIDVIGRFERLARALDRRQGGVRGVFDAAIGAAYRRVMLDGLRQPIDAMLLSETRKVGPDWAYTLGVPNVNDVFQLVNHHVDGLGVTGIFGGMQKKRKLRAAEREMYQMLSAHIKAGRRLRSRLRPGSAGGDAPSGGAVIDDRARVVHAEGDAESKDARGALEQMARRIDHSRSQQGRQDPTALKVWTGLVQGRWSLVEHFDVDGRRFVLAHKNAEHVRDPRGLTAIESRVIGLAVRGYSNKLIAYHLGMPEGSVSAQLHGALRKLRIGSRVELVRTLGRHYPQNTDPRFHGSGGGQHPGQPHTDPEIDGSRARCMALRSRRKDTEPERP